MAFDSGPESLPIPGTRLAHYEVEGEVGRGGMGVVFLARDVGLNRPVALKSPLDLDHDSVQRFLSEARAASRLNSPYVVGVHEVFTAQGRPWMVMEFVRGESLRARLRRDGAPSLEDIVRWAMHLTEALEVSHQKGLLHRDINPKNVLLDADGRARLTDFGLAKAYVSEDEVTGATTRVSLTRSGAVVGTRGYMSPEQVLGRTLDPRTDVFSLGATLYEMCSGRPAFRRSESSDVLDAILNHEPPPLSDVRPDTPAELDRIVRKALAKEPGDRYPSANAMHADLLALRRHLEFESYSHDIVSVTSRAWRRWRRGAIAAVAVAMAAVVLAVGPWRWGRPPQFDPTPTRSLAMVTWPTVEFDSRLSPDGQWISFVSDRGGEGALWVRKVSGGEPRRVDTNEGVVLGHVWSPDSQEMAVILSAEGTTRVDFVTAPLGSWPRRSAATEVSRLVDWIDTRLFLERARDGSLWAMDVATAEVTSVSEADPEFDFRRDFSVRDDQLRIAFAGVRNGVENVWVAQLDGSQARAVTSGEALAHSPRWSGSDRLLYVSNQGEQQGLWTIGLSTGRSQQIPIAQPAPYLEDTDDSGQRATVQVVHEEAHLWRWRPGSTPRHLTAESLGDFHSSFSALTGQVAFARSLPGRRIGSSFLDTSIELAEVTGDGLDRVRTVVNRGTAPILSPDGKRVAYLRRSGRPPYFTDLRVKDLSSQQDVLVSDSFQYSGVYSRPPELKGAAMAWVPDGSRLCFVTGDESFASSLVAASAPDFRDLETLYDGPARVQVLDVVLRADGAVVFVTHGPGWGDWKVLERHPEASQAVVAYRPEHPVKAVSLLGASHPDSLLVVQAMVNDDQSYEMSLLHVARGGVSSSLLSFPRCDPGTARWRDPWFYVAVVNDGIHDIVRANPRTGRTESVTANDLPGVTFSCIQPLPDEEILFSRQVVNADIWLLEFSNPNER